MKKHYNDVTQRVEEHCSNMKQKNGEIEIKHGFQWIDKIHIQHTAQLLNTPTVRIAENISF